MNDMKLYRYVKQQMGYVVKLVVACFSLISLWLLRSSFTYCKDEKFRNDLRLSGFHPSVVNNPFILFQGIASDVSIRYNQSLVQICLKVFLFSFRLKCWNNRLNLSRIFAFVGLKNAYCKNINLLIDSKTFSPYKEIDVPNVKTEKQYIVVYSVMIGDYDEVFDPVYISDNCDYILYTDQINLKLDVWKVVYVDKTNFQGKTNKWISTYYKVLAHSILPDKYTYSIYVDTKVFVCGNIVDLLNSLNSDHKLAMIKHTFRQRLIDEMNICVSFGYAKRDQIQTQYEKYIDEGFTDTIGLIDSCILIREHKSIDVIKTMQLWFDEFNEFPSRDQFSIMYAIWKIGVNYIIHDGSVWSNQFCIVKKHKQ